MLAELAEPALLAAPTVRLVRLGGQAALFCERRQQLYALNETAAALWQAPVHEDPLVDTWLDLGLLVPADVAARAAGPADAELHLRIADLAAVIRLHGVAPPTAFDQFRGPPGHGLRLDLVEGGWLLVDGAPHGRFSEDRLVPELKAVLTDRLAQATGDGAFLLHAALLSHEGRGLLITGRPGAGKTTLTLALAARGLGYASDDIVRVGPDGALQGIPFSPAAKSGAWKLPEAQVPEAPAHLRADGQQVRYVPVAGVAQPGTVAWALLLDRRDGASPCLEPVPALAILTELLASAHAADRRLSADTLDAFAARLAGLQGYRLTFSDLAEACAAIEALVRG